MASYFWYTQRGLWNHIFQWLTIDKQTEENSMQSDNTQWGRILRVWDDWHFNRSDQIRWSVSNQFLSFFPFLTLTKWWWWKQKLMSASRYPSLQLLTTQHSVFWQGGKINRATHKRQQWEVVVVKVWFILYLHRHSHKMEYKWFSLLFQQYMQCATILGRQRHTGATALCHT